MQHSKLLVHEMPVAFFVCGKDAIAVDGKTLRTSRNRDNKQPHCLSAATHQGGIVLGDLLVSNKHGETDFIKPLLDGIDIKKSSVYVSLSEK